MNSRIILMSVLLVTLSPALCAQKNMSERGEVVSRGALELGPESRLPIDGLALQVFASAAPDDAERLLVCTFEMDGRHGLHPSAAYVSLDAGNSWMRTLYVTDSDWVSETSCAAGRNGRAYFFASVSDTSGDGMGHRGGTGELFRSGDGGIHWNEPSKYPFIDWTRMVLDPKPDSSEETVYLFGNRLAKGMGQFGTGEWEKRAAPMFVSRDGYRLGIARFPAADEEGSEESSFPISAVRLADRSLLVLIASKGEYVVYKSDSNGYRAVSRIELPPGMGAASMLDAQMVSDLTTSPQRVYLAFPAIKDGSYALGLATSDDGGLRWRVREFMRGKKADAHVGRSESYASVAVNSEGTVAFEWQEPKECPIFAISRDKGESLDASFPLGNCPEHKLSRELPTAIGEHIWTMNSVLPTDKMSANLPEPPGFTALVEVLSQWSTQLVADVKGRFHAFWSELREDGKPILLTETIASRPTDLLERDPDLGQELTPWSLVRIRNEEFDPYNGQFEIDLSIRNKGPISISYPLALVVASDHSDCGAVVFRNPGGTSEAGKAFFRIPRSESEFLSSNQETLPVHIVARVEGCKADELRVLEAARLHQGKSQFQILALEFRVYARKN